MSIRSITVQYIGNVLFLPKSERNVKLIVERDYGTADPDKRFVMERTCEMRKEGERMTEYIVNFGDDKSSAFVRLAMAEVACHGAKLREEVVRCRDCEHFYDDSLCDLGLENIGLYSMVEPDGFCAWGKRSL